MKRLLVVVNYQNDFITGSLGFPQAREIDSKIAQKINRYHENHDVVAFIMNYHSKEYLGTQEGQNLPIKHCIEGTEGAEMYGQTAQACKDQDRQFKSNAFGAASFFRHLDSAQRSAANSNVQAFRSIELVGLVTNVSVLANAVLAKTACPEVPVYVDASCVAAPSLKANEQALDIMESLQVIVTNRQQKSDAVGPSAKDATCMQPPVLPHVDELTHHGHTQSVILNDADIEKLKHAESRVKSHGRTGAPHNPAYTGTADITVPDGVSASEDSTAPMKPIPSDDDE